MSMPSVLLVRLSLDSQFIVTVWFSFLLVRGFWQSRGRFLYATAHFIHDIYAMDYSVFPGVPSPKRLFLERRFTRSVLVSWKPADLPPEKVKGYGVYVNGDLRFMIKGGDETKALLEDIDEEEVKSVCLPITRVLSLENTGFLYPSLLSKVFTCNLIFKVTSTFVRAFVNGSVKLKLSGFLKNRILSVVLTNYFTGRIISESPVSFTESVEKCMDCTASLP